MVIAELLSMYPTAQPHQRDARQERWPSETSFASAGPSHAGTTYIPLPPEAPALPPSRPPIHTYPAVSPRYPAFPPPPAAHVPPQCPQTHAYGFQVPPSPLQLQSFPQTHGYPMTSSLAERLVNPYEQREQSMAHSAAHAVQNPHRRDAMRQSLGPGDPIFSSHHASIAHSSDGAPRPPLSPRPPSLYSPSQLATTSAVPQTGTQRTPSSLSVGQGPRSSTVTSSNMPGPAHGVPGHEADDCPGCLAEMGDAIKASLQSAQNEDEKRQRELQDQQELERIYALSGEENERSRRLAEEEEQLLQKAIQDSRREAEEQSQRIKQHEAQMLEESRKYALRQHEQNERLEADMLEAAKLASSTQERHRRRELDAMQEAEQRAIEISLREQEEEWARRESAERSILEFIEHKGSIVVRPTTPIASPANNGSTSRSASPDSLTSKRSAAFNQDDANDLGAEYWRFAGHDDAYHLALQMQRATLADHNEHSPLHPSAPRTRRPLPRTPDEPEPITENQDHSITSVRKKDLLTASSQPATLFYSEDAPPAYAEASKPEPASLSLHDAAASRPQEKALPARYDTATFETLNRPVLQHRSSSSSSAHSQSRSSPLISSPMNSFTGASLQAKRSSSSTTSSELLSAPYPSAPSPSIPERGSSHSTPEPKRFSTSTTSLASEQRGPRALAGIDFGYGSLPFAPKLDRNWPATSQSVSSSNASASASSSSLTTKALFPSTIELSSVVKVLGADSGLSGCSFFVLRAHSWKSLLRAIAWYGNSRVEASPAQVAAASDRRSRCLLRAEVEFVTPTRVDLGYGVGEYARVAQSTGSMPKNPSPAHVALCLSLLPLSASKSGEASAWLKSEEYQITKRESRRLDAWYAGKGSTRRLVQLARQPPALPVTMVQIAQLLHASHSFSAACPSSGSTARHSPRDLHHAIERHDEGFVRKQQAMLLAGSALASHSGSGSLSASANARVSMQDPRRRSTSNDPTQGAGVNELDDDDDGDDDEIDFNDFSLLADGSFDAQDKVLMGKRQRLKAKVKRRLAKRASDGRVVDEDLAAWITPFDLSQHG